MEAAARDSTRPAQAGSLIIGGGAPVSVQTMTNTETADIPATSAQIARAAARGAELVRLAVPDEKAARALPELVSLSPVPLSADIHFDWRLALTAIQSGIAGLRLNPGNIREPKKILRVAEAAGKAGTAIRVGVNAGSLDPAMAAKYGHSAEALVRSALAELKLIESTGFANLLVSVKASSVSQTVAAVRLLARECGYPQHLGITEAGDLESGSVKSSVGLGILLHEGLGDTIRVSLTGPPEAEVDCAWEILRSLDLRRRGPEFISCPTCGRCAIDLPALLKEVKDRLRSLKTPLKIAVMGCTVNGPGEAKMADAGIAGGRGSGALFVKGRLAGRYPYDQLAGILEKTVRELAGEES
ncbi:MAG: flavodoxin-dependent (E)-4-hydroxy-3-methylbut-2-enyl-diphosphate synthase [Deltaproteobacteria bacterium]|nr:flavodoxin-dependent (E)-4-hydroxy-3-methylbut-2-enyl-diphosphate synthase [Deltaproteobacteria bacterium]